MSTPIHDITPFTLIDYPGKTACIIWFAGCNMRCLYCYNTAIVLEKGKLSFNDALHFLHKRKNLLDGVVLSGGECTIHKNLEVFIADIKLLGMLVKIDTNGSNPTLMQRLIDKQLVDYVSLDFKAPPKKFQYITQADLFVPFEQTLDILTHSSLPFEVRTTVHSALLDKDTVYKMIDYLHSKNYTNTFYIQQHVNNTKTLADIGHSNNYLHANMFCGKALNVVIRN